VAIRPAASEDVDGLRGLYRCYAPDVYVCVRRLVPNHEDAEDVTQQVFLKLAARGSGAYPRSPAWMLRVARNAAIDHLRHVRAAPRTEPIDRELAAEPVDPDRVRSLRAAFAGLPPAQREVFLLRAVAGLTPGEAAARLGTTPGAVNTSYHRARLATRQALEASGWTPMTRTDAAAST